MVPEVAVFFEAVLLGALLGALYDVFRILRLSFPNGRVLIFLEDVLYFALAAVVSFSFVVLQNGGVLRAFLLLGELLGAVLYFFTLGVLVMKAAGLIIRLIRSVLSLLFRLTVRPLIRLFRWVGRKLRALLRLLRSKYAVIKCKTAGPGRFAGKMRNSLNKFPSRNSKKHLKQNSKIVYNDDMQYSGAEAAQKEPDGKGRNRFWQRKRQGSR